MSPTDVSSVGGATRLAGRSEPSPDALRLAVGTLAVRRSRWGRRLAAGAGRGAALRLRRSGGRCVDAGIGLLRARRGSALGLVVRRGLGRGFLCLLGARRGSASGLVFGRRLG